MAAAPTASALVRAALAAGGPTRLKTLHTKLAATAPAGVIGSLTHFRRTVVAQMVDRGEVRAIVVLPRCGALPSANSPHPPATPHLRAAGD